jgi:hypothetical protein
LSSPDPKRQKIRTRSEPSGDDEDESDSNLIIRRPRPQRLREQIDDDAEREDDGYASEMSNGLEVDYNRLVEDEGPDETLDEAEREEIQDLTEDERIAM